MSLPDIADVYAAIDGTWPARRVVDIPGWQVREGAGGGNRVSAATATTATPDISAMESAHRDLGQTPLVMIRHDEAALDRDLQARGYRLKAPVTVYACAVEDLADTPPPVTTFHVSWPPVEIQTELWAEGGIGPGRIGVMNRVDGPKCAILGRCDDHPAGVAFVARHGDIAMLHALEVTPHLRRKGMARHIMQGAALWAAEQVTTWLAVLVTDENAAAGALYKALGMAPVGHYHYRTL